MSSKPRFGGEKVRLGDCFPYIKNGYNVRQGKDKGGMPITRIETLSDNRFNRDKVGYADIFSTKGLENHILEDGDILMSHINSLPYLGRSVMYRARPGEVFIHGMNLLRLKADRSVVEPGYAELYFRSPRFKQHVLKIAKKAVNQASFSVSDLKEIEFPLMSLCDQHDVIEKLSSVTTQIEHCQRAIGKLDSLVKSRFVEMFLNSSWPIATIGECSMDIHYGTSEKASTEGEYVYLRMNNMGDDGSLDLSDIKRITLEGKALSNCLVRKGDLLFNRTNSREKVGKTCVFCLDEPMVIAGYIIRVRLDDRVDSTYLAAYMNLSSTKALLRGMAKGAVHQANINAKQLASIKFPLADIKAQKEFVSFVAQVDKSRFIAQQQIEKLQMLYDSLAQDYFGD